MCIPSQITCNCYSKVFNAFDVFKVSSLQGIWRMDLLDPFSCQLHHIAFDRLESHTPLPCPGTQSINIPLKFHCVFFILNFTIANIDRVISKKVLFQTQYLMRCLCTKRITRDQERCPGGHPKKPEPSQILLHLLLSEAKGDTRQNRSPVRFYSICCCLKQRKESIHFNVLPPIP